MIVMKFGGTSIQDVSAIHRVVQIVKKRIATKPVIVISAMGKTTKNLLAAARLSASGKHQEAQAKLEDIRSYHESVASEAVSNWSGTEGKKRINGYFEDMRKLLDGIAILGELSSRSQDKMLSYGELISTSIIQEAFRQSGIPSVWMDARPCVITDERFTSASPLREETQKAIRLHVQSVVSQNKVPVLQGYIGSTPNGATTTLGFEGSDFSAALFGAALDATEIQIWKDVPGVMTADPKMVPEARTVKNITFEEAAELTFFGAKVLHPKSIEPAQQKNLPVYVCNSKEADRPGSWITDNAPMGKNAVKSIAYKQPLYLMRIHSLQVLPMHEFYQSTMDAVTRENMVPLVFNTAESSVLAALDENTLLESLQNHLKRFARVEIRSGKGAISLIGQNIRSNKDLAARVFTALKDESIDWISFGASNASMTIVLDGSSIKRVLNALHAELFRELDPELFY